MDSWIEEPMKKEKAKKGKIKRNNIFFERLKEILTRIYIIIYNYINLFNQYTLYTIYYIFL